MTRNFLGMCGFFHFCYEFVKFRAWTGLVSLVLWEWIELDGGAGGSSLGDWLPVGG